MIMATISENLQIIKDSTDAIKQAIIDKGGTINGDITTWASAIGGISGGGSDDTVFQCNLTQAHGTQGKFNFTGTIDFGDNYPGPGIFYMFIDTDGLIRSTHFTSIDTPISFTNVDLYGQSYVLFAVYVPESTNTYAMDAPGVVGSVSAKSFYRVNVTIN
jgi:hypothetical protein